MTAESRDYLSVADTAELLGYSEKTVRVLIKRGDIPAAQIGRQWIIPRSKLEAVINARIEASHAT